MAVRLLEMHRLLKPSGSIYLHFDSTASHYLKAVMDAIFGWRNFNNEIIWQKIRSSKAQRTAFGSVHDNILFYKKARQSVFTKLYSELSPERVARHYGKTEADTKRRYGLDNFTQAGQGKPRRFGDRIIPPPKGKHWIWDQKHIDKAMSAGRLVFTSENMLRVKRYLDESKGNPMEDIWIDIAPINAMSKERLGYPTQKPIALYERIVSASSKKGGIVLDPFAGCATTLVACEKLRRQWVGMDIWDNAHEIVLHRLELEGLIEHKTTDGKHGYLFPGDITFTAAPPIRTDDGQPAAPNLRTKVIMFEPSGPKMTRAEMYKHLLGQHGIKCQGCDRTFDDPRYLELDHNTPRSDGGLNHISNRILLCGPCNRLKSNTLTLTGLRRKNKKFGYMANQEGEHPILREIREKREKAPPLFR